MAIRMSAAQAAAAVARCDRSDGRDLAATLARLGLAGSDGGTGGGGGKRKRRGLDTRAIFQSIKTARAHVDSGHIDGQPFLVIRLDGARLLTANDLISLWQCRPYETYRYKRICHNAITRALERFSAAPRFTGRARLTLYRSGKKGVDRDALSFMFKYLVDALKQCGVIDDDNPNVIVGIVPLQVAAADGLESVGLRLDAVDDQTSSDQGCIERLFGKAR